MNVDNFILQFQNYIDKNQLIPSSENLIIACSGGVDSIVITHILHYLKYGIALAHCNFSLREEESDGDEAFVRQLAEKKNAPFYSIRFETKKYAFEKGVSIQMAARELRYNWFNELLDTKPNTLLVTAHHADDQVETVLFNTVKGGGVSSSRGITPQRDRIIRPLLWASKNEIVEFAQIKKLEWREDKSNSSVDYARNKLRHQVVPILRELNQNLTNTITNSTERVLNTELLLSIFIQNLRRKLLIKANNVTKFPVKAFLDYKQNPVLIFELLKEYNFNYNQCVQISASLVSQSGKIFESKTHKLLIDRDYLLVKKKSYDSFQHEIIYVREDDVIIDVNQINLRMTTVSASSFNLKKDNLVGAFDFNRLSFPMVVRKWRKGDKFQPLGMRGKKLVSDFLTDRKINLFEKEDVNVLCSKNEIVWVIGYQISHSFRITNETSKIYQIELNSKND